MALVANVRGVDIPSATELWLVFSTKDRPLSTYLKETDELCRQITIEESEELVQPVDPIPEIELEAVPSEQRETLISVWANDLNEYYRRLRAEIPPDGYVWACQKQDYIGATVERSEDTRLRRDLITSIDNFLSWYLSVPAVLLAIGLFLFWAPLRKD